MAEHGILAVPNLIDLEGVTLSGGDWQIPLEALTHPALQRVARSADADPASTRMQVDLGRARAVKVVVVCGHNCDLDATWRVRGWLDMERTELAYDSGELDMFPPLFSIKDLAWEEPNCWSGRVSEEDIDIYPRNAIHILPASQYLRYWDADIFNATNPAGYVDVGRLHISPGWIAEVNFSRSASLGHETATTSDASLAGVEWFDRREPLRVAYLRFDALTKVEGVNRAMATARRAGIDKQVFLCMSPDDALLMQQTSFLGRLRNLSPLDFVHVDLAGMSFEIKEVSWRKK